MEVPIRLARRETALPADAFLLLAEEPARLAAACVQLGGELPRVFTVRGGFLLVPHAALERSVSGAIRLRRLSGELFVPADADLLPALLADEMGALTRDRGLVVLPGGVVLAFDTNAPLPASRWLAPARVRRVEWGPFPPRPDRPHALSVIERPVPQEAPLIEVLGQGSPEGTKPLPGPGEGAGEKIPEDARPASGSSMIGRAAASAGLATAGFLAWLGRQLGAGGLARLGGDLARRALEAFPRLSEKVLGEQEAALRDVLRELQTGDVEKGLRLAPPAVADPDQPARVGTDARLSPRDPRYSLRDLIGTGGGVPTAWLGGGDVWAALAREYRRLAAEAVARGDHRRAAYLYGVLLRDLRAAANTLMAGGFYRDAALLFRDRLKDPLAAADAFDRAGDHDEAVRLYDRLAEYERAGDLLRRLGEEARAVAYYRRAAAVLAAGNRFIAAGDLLRKKAYLRDEAINYYRHGWRMDGAESLTCGERLLDEARAAADRDAVEELWTDGELLLGDRPRDAGRFFNYALRTAGEFMPDDARADLRDRARLHFAAHMRTRAIIGEAGALVAELFPVGHVWAPPVGRDAAFAARNRRPEVPPKPEVPEKGLVRIANGAVAAVAVVRDTFDLVVAAVDGIFYWRVAEGQIVPVWAGRETVTAVAPSARGEVIFAVARGPDEKWQARAFAADRSGGFHPTTNYALPTDGSENPAVYLQPAAVFRNGEHRVTVATPGECLGFAGPYLQPGPAEQFIDDGRPIRLIAETADGRVWHWAGGFVCCRTPGDVPTLTQWPVSWVPASRVEWLSPAAGVLEIAAVDDGGCVRWAEFDTRLPTGPRERAASASHPKGYAAVCLVAPGVLAAATNGNVIWWLRLVGGRLVGSTTQVLDVPAQVIALAPRPDVNEVVAILADGHALRVRKP